jgi:hypothetical protein
LTQVLFHREDSHHDRGLIGVGSGQGKGGE